MVAKGLDLSPQARVNMLAARNDLLLLHSDPSATSARGS